MNAPPLDDDLLYQALIDRDPSYDGFAYVGVRTTGVFCRLTCPARNPKRENVVFFPDLETTLRAGFRPCKRCRPLDPPGATGPIVSRLIRAVESDPERRWRERDLVDLGFDPSTVRRAFRQHFGMTFLQVARSRRLGLAATRLNSGGKVIDAQLDAGYESGSGFREAFVRTFGSVPARARGAAVLNADWIPTPLGLMLAIADREALHLLEFNDRTALPGEIKRLRARTGLMIGHGRTPPIDRVEGELAAYFDGRAASFETSLALHGTPFERGVWDALRRIPLGATRSYGGLAAALGRPTAARAVARANGANQLAVVIPCHRVIGADGALTGYGGKLWRKRWLLEHERRMGSAPAVA